jgi:hypothetical protein
MSSHTINLAAASPGRGGIVCLLVWRVDQLLNDFQLMSSLLKCCICIAITFVQAEKSVTVRSDDSTNRGHIF